MENSSITMNDNEADLFADLAALTIHDVKNSLNQLANDASARGDLNGMKIALHACEALTGLLCFYRSETHHLHLQIDAHDPSEMLCDLLENIPLSLRQQSGLKFSIEVDGAPGIAFYDRNLIEMVLANALQNAIRFARSQVIIGAKAQLDRLEFFVHDDGPGYPQAVLEERDAYSPVTRNGTGLGLRLAHRVLSMHENNGLRGEIHLSNRSGAHFQLYLP
ncbi:ATP-binding protein [Undibacterium cyanobacteriorum]|uniref:histidine kinase n=1 Tax=Undibacterium cyanobacteriorum TaxID=3073561 RepID=A0ABY9RLK8_9BURK|nr:ATP-binding protein [Undibacterium sp. 20NA77.5]WMW82101.1 ATP-binding protein [Undibacterium sp. 20NA77.5]